MTARMVQSEMLVVDNGGWSTVALMRSSQDERLMYLVPIHPSETISRLETMGVDWYGPSDRYDAGEAR
jgi:predicted phosphoribosyltransferase